MNNYEIGQRLARLEQLVEGLYRHFDIPVSPAADDRMEPVLRLLALNKKIQAIKVYRELTGVGLKEAKEAVDRMQGSGRW